MIYRNGAEQKMAQTTIMFSLDPTPEFLLLNTHGQHVSFYFDGKSQQHVLLNLILLLDDIIHFLCMFQMYILDMHMPK